VVHFDASDAAPEVVGGWLFPVGDIALEHTDVSLETIETLGRLRPDDRMSTFRGLSAIGRSTGWLRGSVEPDTLEALFGQWGTTLNASNPARQYVVQMSFYVAVGTVSRFMPSIGYPFDAEVKLITGYDATMIDGWSTTAWSLMKSHKVIYDVLQPMARMLVESFTDRSQRGAESIMAAVALPYMLSSASGVLADLEKLPVSSAESTETEE
jgi:hypothetical protein